MTGLARFEHAWLTLAAPYHVPLHGARKTTSLGQCMCVRCKRPAGKLVCEDITTSCSGGGIPKAADDVFVRCAGLDDPPDVETKAEKELAAKIFKEEMQRKADA